MKKLILIRHAKSSWKYDVIDHERPLNTRGKKDAHLVSGHLAQLFLKPHMVLISDALRTKNTASIFIENLNMNRSIVHLNHDLYDFSGNHLIRTIKQCSDKAQELMVFGHNHAITFFVNTYGDEFIENVPTCGVVLIEFDIEKWKNLKRGKILKTVFPRDLKK